MPTFHVQIARSVREYATTTITADDEEQAQAEVERILESDGDEYLALVNGVSWNPGEDTFDEEVIDVERVKEPA